MTKPQTHNPHFKGFLTKMLHEAFYLEEDYFQGERKVPDNFDLYEPEEEIDKATFIKSFLRPFMS